MNQYVIAAVLVCAQHTAPYGYAKGFEHCPTILAEYADELQAEASLRATKQQQVVVDGYASIPNWRRYELEHCGGHKCP